MEDINKVSNKNASPLFYLALSAYILQGTLSSVDTNYLSSLCFVCQLVALASLSLKLIIENDAFEKVFALAPAIGIIALCCYYSQMFPLLWLAVFVLAGKGIRFRSAALCSFLSIACALIVAIMLLRTGITTDTLFYRNGVERHSYGFTTPNSLARTVLICYISYLCYVYPKFRIIHYVILVLIIGFIWTVTNSRTMVALSILTLLIMLLSNRIINKNRARIFTTIFEVIFIIVCTYSILAMIFYTPSNAIINVIDELLTGRMYLNHYYYSLHPNSLIGIGYYGVSFVNSHVAYQDSLIVDNSYCCLVIKYGWIVAITFIVLSLFVFRKARNEEYIGPAILFFAIFAIAGYSESFMISLSTNITLLLFSPLLYSESYNSFDSISSKREKHENYNEKVRKALTNGVYLLK